MYLPAVPTISFSGPPVNSPAPGQPPRRAVWADYFKFCSMALQRAQAGAFAQKYAGKIVHWHGTLLGVDAPTNAVLFKMTPSVNKGPTPDLALRLPAQVPVAPMAPMIVPAAMKTMDFIAKLVNYDNNVITADYVAVGGPFLDTPTKALPPALLQALKAIPPAFENTAALERQLGPEYPAVAAECSFPALGLSEAIFELRFKPAQAVVTGQVVTMNSQQITLKCHPRNMPEAPFDLVVTVTDVLKQKLPAGVKPGALVSFHGKFTAMCSLRSPNIPPTLAGEQATVHVGPNAKLEALPTKGGDASYVGADDKALRDNKRQIDEDMALHRNIRVGRMPVIPTTPLTSPSTAPGTEPQSARSSVPPTPKATEPKPQLPEPKTEVSPAPAEAPEETKEPESKPEPEPEAEPKEEQPAEEEKGEETEETAEPEPPKKPVITEPPKVIVEEVISDVAGKDPLELALELMQKAPDASYTVKHSVLDAPDAEESDPVARMAQLKCTGFDANAFLTNSDQYIDQIGRLGSSKPTYGDTDEYDVGRDGGWDAAGDSWNTGGDNWGSSNYDSYGGNYDSYGGGYGGSYGDNSGSYGGGNYDSYGGGYSGYDSYGSGGYGGY